MIENDKPQEIAIVIGVQSQKQELSVDEYLDELEQLVYTSGAKSIKRFTQKLEHPHAKTYVGKGKMQEIAEYCKNNRVDIAIFDDELSPAQVRNLEKEIPELRIAIISVLFASFEVNQITERNKNIGNNKLAK